MQTPLGYSRAPVRHGVSRIVVGTRDTLGVIFHDAKSPGSWTVQPIISGERLFQNTTKGGEQVAKGKSMRKEKKKPKQKQKKT